MSLFKSTATIGFYTLISRIFGFLRDVLIANMVGANANSDAFFVAFKIPNFLRRLFAEGAFNASFIPMFAGKLEAEGRESARAFAAQIMAILLSALIIITLLFIVFMPSIMRVLAPGFVDDTAKFELTVLLTRITFSYIIFISLVSLFGGILNSIERFAAVAATPILMNVCLISALVFFSAYLPSSVHALAYGVILAGVVQFLWLAYHCYRHGMLPCFKWPRITPEVREMLLLMAPAALGVGVVQINLFIDNILASMIPNAVSYLYYADRMNELPLAIIGIAVGTALLPMLTKHYKAGRIFEGQASMNRALEFTMLLGLPAAAAFVIVAEPIIQVVFERGEFTKEDTDATHRALMAYAIGLPAFLLTKVFAPGFFAQKDTKTPFMIAAVCVVINLIFNLLLMGPLQHVGLALATSIAGWVNATWMAILLRKRNILFPDHEVQFRLPRILLATMLMAVALYTMLHFVIPFFAEGALLALLTLIALIASGLVSYGLSVWLLDVVSIKRLKAYLRQTKPLASAEED